MPEQEIGKIAHYFNKIGVAIHIKGHTSDWTQTVGSLQIEHDSVEKAGTGDSVGLKVDGHAHLHDAVYKVTD
jgi:translation elongation factor EF-1alpha